MSLYNISRAALSNGVSVLSACWYSQLRTLGIAKNEITRRRSFRYSMGESPMLGVFGIVFDVYVVFFQDDVVVLAK